MNVKIVLAYDGTHYFGWQKSASGPTIEEELERVLERICRHKIQLQAASRTDAGVHARGQVVNVQMLIPRIDLLFRSLEKLLPPDIRPISIECVDDAFHPTLDCIGKEYHYELCYGRIQLPQWRHFSWHMWYPIDLAAIREGAKLLIGKHDFAALTNHHEGRVPVDTVREITALDVVELPDQRLRFIVRGNHFLYKMVRNLVGTLVFTGRGKIAVDAIPSILTERKRTLAGITAPAHGLTLQKIFY